jgi:hypothetical protein
MKIRVAVVKDLEIPDALLDPSSFHTEITVSNVVPRS